MALLLGTAHTPKIKQTSLSCLSWTTDLGGIRSGQIQINLMDDGSLAFSLPSDGASGLTRAGRRRAGRGHHGGGHRGWLRRWDLQLGQIQVHLMI